MQGRNLKESFVLNLADDIIKVLAGISEIVGKDKVLRRFGQVLVSTNTKYCVSYGNQIPNEASSALHVDKSSNPVTATEATMGKNF